MSQRVAAMRLAGPTSRAFVALISVQLGVWIALNIGGAFSRDDLIYLAIAHEQGFSPEWLSSIYFQHWGPGYRGMFWLFQTSVPPSFVLAFAFQLGLLGASLALMAATLRELFGRRWLDWALVSIFGFSLFFVMPLEWPAAGLQVFPGVASVMGCTYAFVRYQRDRSNLWPFLGFLATTLGLLFYIRPLFVVAYLVLLRLLFFTPSVRPGAVWRALRADAVFWVAILVPCVFYVANYWLNDYVHVNPPPKVYASSASEVEAMFRIAWLRGFTPGYLGVQVTPTNTTTFQEGAVVVAQALLAAVVLYSFWLKRSAWRAWVFWVCTFFISVALLYPRIALFGSSVGYEDRYLAELPLLFTLALAFALSPRRLAGGPAGPGDDAGEAPRRVARRRHGQIVLALFGVAVIGEGGIFLHTAIHERDIWRSDDARSYFDNLRSGVQRARGGGRPVNLAEGFVPEAILEAQFAPYPRLSRLVPLYVEDAQVAGPGPVTHVVQGDGTVAPARFAPIAGSTIRRLQAAHLVQGVSGRVEMRPGTVCERGSPVPASVLVQLPTDQHPTGQAFALRVEYTTTQPQDVLVFADVGGGFTGGGDATLALRPDQRTTSAGLAGQPRAVRIDLPPGSGACLNAVSLGFFAPRSG